MKASQQAFGQPQSWWKRLTGRAKAIIVLLILAILAYVLFHGRTDHSKNHNPSTLISVASALRKDVPITLDGLGTVQAYNTVTLHTQVDGQLVKILFNEGQDVRQGDVLAKIDPRTYQAAYDQAVANKAKDEANLNNAKHDVERYVALGDTISKQTVDTQRATVRQLEATVKADQAAIDSAATTLSYTSITSPIDGRTGIRQVDVGNIVHTGDTNGLVVITELQPISVMFSLPQQNLQAINEQLNAKPDQKLQVQALASDNQTVLDTGVLELVDNQIDQGTGTIKLKATFPNEKRMLWPGGFTNVRLLVTTQHDALVIPTVAVQRGPQGISYVFVYKPDDNTVSMRTIKAGITTGQDTVITDGVQEKEQVVTDGMAKLQDGSKVSVASDKPADEAKPAENAKPEEKSEQLKKHPHKEKDGQ